MAESPSRTPNFKAYLTVGEAAAFLGVSPSTLRHWDRVGRFKAGRHPLNGYRLYEREALERLLQQLMAQTPAAV
jgi:DNA-binding transcriptional MerR regulator